MNIEQQRLQDIAWKKWGNYMSDRQWGTVREDYSAGGDAWQFTSHEMARSKAWRWGEDGIAGFCDYKQRLCFALALWNKKDTIIKERFFGLTNFEGNHGEDVKEIYYYLDGTPTHSYMKMLYKYPQSEFPYEWLLDENKNRDRSQPEFELVDTGIFNNNKYFDVFIEYAKAGEEDILIKITVHNRGDEDAAINILPTIWFRNTWAWGYDDYKPNLSATNNGNIFIEHKKLGNYFLHLDKKAELLFCDNETNNQKLYNTENLSAFAKDGINEFLINQNQNAINKNANGTKGSINYELIVKAGEAEIIRLRLEKNNNKKPFENFDNIFKMRLHEADIFYADLQKEIKTDDEKLVQRQAFAGMLWNKQFYYYDVDEWLTGDPLQPPPPPQRKHGRNSNWRHLNNEDIISIPDNWEYPWYASWDLAFHCISFALIDAGFAKQQLSLLTKEWYMHPCGQLPACEWGFSNVHPPVHAWAAWRVYKIDEKNNGKADLAFLEAIFHKLLLNFTWWVNRKDREGNNIFEGGFLGLDNIGVFDRSAALPNGTYIEQTDGTSWMAMYSLNLMRIALELSLHNPVYQDMATKFFEHFLYIANALANIGEHGTGLWDEEDQFFYDVLKLPHKSHKLKVRSIVGLIPLFAVEVIDHKCLEALPEFAARLKWFLANRPQLASLVSHWQEKGKNEKHLLSLLRGHRTKKLLQRMLDETEFLSDYGIRSVSKYHEEHPYQFNLNSHHFSVNYSPAESEIGLFGGNSNWRGPIWMPINFLIIESLQRFHHYYGDDFKVECPTNSGKFFSLFQVAEELTQRLTNLFLRDENGSRPVFGDNELFQKDVQFNNYILFYEYFNGDNGKGLGASHQTGWTGLIAKLLNKKIE